MVRIWLQGSTIFMDTEKYDESFRVLARRHKFEWNRAKRCWSRIMISIDEAESKAREMINLATDEGFYVSTDIDRQPYEPENMKMIELELRSNGDFFKLSWPYEGANYWSVAMKVPGARKAKGGIIVPVANWSEVLEFAAMYGFAIRPCAMAGMRNEAGHPVELPDLEERDPGEFPYLSPKNVKDEIHESLRDDN